MKYYEVEHTIDVDLENVKTIKYRFDKFPTAFIMALSEIERDSRTNFDAKALSKYYDDIFEKTKVYVSNSWFPLKEEEREVYYPQGIEEDLSSLFEIATTFMNEVVLPFFQKWAKLKKEQELKKKQEMP